MGKLYGYIFLIVFLILSRVSPGNGQNLGFSLLDGRKKVEIPIEIHNNLVVVPVVLNGVLPLKFILDTGVRTAILTQKTFSDILNLAYARKFTITGPGGEKMADAYITNNVSIDLPGVSGRGHALLVLEEDYLELRNYLGTDVHGVLGYELFSRFIVKVDYEKKLLTLYSTNSYHKKRSYESVKIEIEDTKPYITTPLTLANGITFNAKLLMDSGASHALLLDPQTDERIEVPKQAVSSSIGRGLGGNISGKAGRIKAIQLGKYNLPDVIANFPDPNSYSDSSRVKVFRNGTLGGEIMSRFTIIFNFPKEEAYLKKNDSFKKKFYYNVSGIMVKSKGARLNVFEITEVRKNSSGDKAGLREGDIIYALNGMKAETLNLNTVLSILNEKPGKRVSIDVLRKGDILKKRLLLEDEI